MRLRYLELQGYKSFAARTEFIFDGGITAIVGPNGSGKSNIADAIRWVLGEQSYRTLRGKRTEDMIFSGSALRTRLGMASASLTLDNADGWLPIDFVEVTITRRAYRSGENEYLLNNSRVRLRDITELLAKSGLARRTYTVIGQGLVDDVLSLRAEDRRALFEEAAGVSLYQAKRADVLSRLEETRSNLLRVNDIVNEITPRLRHLEREAERAERHALLSQQLDGLLRTWYGFRWRQEQRELHRARDALARREASLSRRREELDALDGQMSTLRARQSQLREELGDWHRESSDLHRQMEAVQRDLAVWQERARLLARQGDEFETERSELETQAQAMTDQITATQEEVAECQLILRDKEDRVARAQDDLDAHEERRADLSRSLTEAQGRILDLAAQVNDQHIRQAQLGERRAAVAKERADHQAAITGHEAHAEDLRSQILTADTLGNRLQAETETLAAEAHDLEVALSKAHQRQGELQSRLAEAQRDIERLQARYDLLTRLRQEGEGLHAGARAVLQARREPGYRAEEEKGHRAARGVLSGIIGTVAQLLYVPAEYEIAIEAALGGHLQDIVVESWSDAEAAIAYLQAEKQGRATFWPLDSVQPVPPLDVPEDPSVVGVAAGLVQASEFLAPVIEILLGRTIVVHDLESARRILRRRSPVPAPSLPDQDGASQVSTGQALVQLQSRLRAVTLAGEALWFSGAVTGGEGQGQVQGQVLAREREWRELPTWIEAARVRGQTTESTLAEAQNAEESISQQLKTLVTRRQEIEQASAQAQAGRRDLEREVERGAEQIAWHRGLIAQLAEEAREIDAAESALQSMLAALASEKEGAENQVAALEAELDQLRGEVLYQRLSEARTEAALSRGTWEHRQAALDSLRDTRTQLQARIEAKSERITDLQEEQKKLAAQIADRAAREAVIQNWLTALARKIEPAEAEVSHLEAEREHLVQEENTLRVRLRQVEHGHAQALLAQSRQEDRLERLRTHIMDDFGLVEMEPMEGLPAQPPLPLGELVSALPVVTSLPEGLEEEIHRVKAQMKRMRSLNPNAPDEYAEVLDRYTFLTTQAADLEEAARSLREVVAELDDVMRREFQATFRAIAVRFEESFTRLFGGGTARLLLTDPDDVSRTGVEIVARPPGKRQQTLAMLSGGERALTAVALIFSILESSPPPFCVLDEVDAMLDEANVKRFRQALEGLAQKTQFIVITHNRGTIQAADTIYGVSMGDTSVSQVVSLRLEGDRVAAPDGSAVEVKAG
jgi:chromosome segregation protein